MYFHGNSNPSAVNQILNSGAEVYIVLYHQQLIINGDLFVDVCMRVSDRFYFLYIRRYHNGSQQTREGIKLNINTLKDLLYHTLSIIVTTDSNHQQHFLTLGYTCVNDELDVCTGPDYAWLMTNPQRRFTAAFKLTPEEWVALHQQLNDLLNSDLIPFN